MNVSSMNKLFPKIDNLEHFPLKVLEQIFEQLDYMDLYNLAEHSCRFESIAKMILSEKYSHEYFIVDEKKCKKETYIEFFKRFGNGIKAIHAKNIKTNGDLHFPDIPWITRLLNIAKNLEKLKLEQLYVEFLFYHVNKNITHLSFRDCCIEPHERFSEFRHLKKLEILDGPFISFDSLAAIVRNNPSLEGLVLADNFYGSRTEISSRYPFNQLIELIATNLNHVKEFGYVIRIPRQVETTPPPDHIVDRFFNSVKHLESLALSSNVDLFMDFTELMYRFQSECRSVKQLKLYDIDGGDMELFNIIRSFENIESLTLACTEFGDEIYEPVQLLPRLRDLDITLHTDDIDWTFVFQVLRKCSTLQQLTVAGDANDGKIEMFGTSQFYNQFVNTVQERNVKLTVKFRDQITGFISKDEVTWRNKLLRWIGHDKNSSDINLLDLAQVPLNAAAAAANAERLNPFDLILGFLDLNSLYALLKANEKCEQLVENYVKQHSQQQGIFTITDEFCSLYREIDIFAGYVTNVRTNILYENIEDILFLQYLLERFDHLTKMYIYTEANVSPHHLIVPQIRHLIFDGPDFRYYSQLHELSVMCPGLETLELKQEVHGHFDEKEKESLEFCNLKRFTLKYKKHIEHLVKNLKTIFENTNTKLCLNI